MYYGTNAVSNSLTEQEARADRLFRSLQIVSHFLFIIGGFVGYLYGQYYGVLVGGILGYVMGTWIRRSMGIRGLKPTVGFFKRMRERASGQPPGMLERLLEGVEGHTYPPQKCKEIALIYERAVHQLRQAPAGEAQNRILADLDRRLWQLIRSN